MNKGWFFVGIAWILACTSLLATRERGLAQAADTPPAHILAPEANAALQGQVSITGNTAVADLQTWMLEFGYADDPTNTWFLIAEGSQPIGNGGLAEWDTTVITDGNYNLRLTTRTINAEPLIHLIPVRLRNYTAIETATPQPAQAATATPQGTPVARVATQTHPTLTPLPTNPAELTPQDVVSSVQVGGTLVVIAFALLAAYIYIRRILRR